MAESDGGLEFDVGKLCVDIGRGCLRGVDTLRLRQTSVAHDREQEVERRQARCLDRRDRLCCSLVGDAWLSAGAGPCATFRHGLNSVESFSRPETRSPAG